MSEQSGAPVRAVDHGGRLNILFVFTDQERYFSNLPPGLSLPGHERLWRTGTNFAQHYVSAVMCTSSRAVILTGLQTADNRMFENTDMPWAPELDPKIPTIGHMLRKAGYYTVYKGKWHLTKRFDQHEPDRLFTRDMEAYGFADYASPGDVVGHTLGGYEFDHLIAGSAITWLRRKGVALNANGTSWCLTVSLVNPHDIMYFDTDAPGAVRQNTGRLLQALSRPPERAFYKASWEQALSPTNTQDLRAPDRPHAHAEYQDAWDVFLGHVPNEPERWRRFSNFYINSLRAVDAQLASIMQELDALGLSDRTIIIFTADHGELGGAHGGMRGKGPFAFEEAIHVPLIVHHPDVQGGGEAKALTSAIDIAPSLLALAGAERESGELAGRELPGKDFTPLLGGGAAKVDAVRDSVLFTYSCIATNDAGMIRAAADAVLSGKSLKALAASGVEPDLRKRGSLRSVYDGRYKFTRYFAPVERNHPGSVDELFAHNDVELFDLRDDPAEARNLAAAKPVDPGLIGAMNSKLERIMDAEFGPDDGREMPDLSGRKIAWTLPTNAID
jgi:arylsulfatase